MIAAQDEICLLPADADGLHGSVHGVSRQNRGAMRKQRDPWNELEAGDAPGTGRI